MICTIKWNILKKDKWNAHFNAIKNCTLLQSHAYAISAAMLYNQRPRWGLIEIDGQEAGLIQIMEAGLLKNMLHAVIADRGPLWFDGFGSDDHFAAFMQEYARQFPKRWGRKRRFIPERDGSPATDAIMKETGFTKTDRPPYQTIWLDLNQPDDTLRAALRKSWRQSLVKAEKSPLTIEWDDTGLMLPWLLKVYDLDKRKRGYDGPDVPVLQVMGKEFVKQKNTLVGMAMLDKRPVAAILILCHGTSATYQIGWSSEDGRKHCAHHRLLWEACAQLRSKNVTSFDLGGINDGPAASVKTFKSGMGGTAVQLAGLYT